MPRSGLADCCKIGFETSSGPRAFAATLLCACTLALSCLPVAAARAADPNGSQEERIPASVFKGVELVDVDPDGTLWRLKAESGSARELDATGRLRTVQAEFQRDGRSVRLEAGTAEVDLGDEVRLGGGVTLRWDGYSARIDRATYLRGEGTIRSDASVQLTGPWISAKGKGIEIDVEGRVARVCDDVHAVLKGARP